MSTGNTTSTDPSSRFVSESVIEEARREREAAWQKAYESGDTSAAPPPESQYDPRTLYERLKEQRQKKDESYAESRRFANQIKKLDPDETDFLESIDEHALEKQRAERQAELLALAQFKDQVAEKRQASTLTSTRVQLGSNKEGRIAAAVASVRCRSKRTDPVESEPSAKRIRSDHNDPDDNDNATTTTDDSLQVPPPPPSGENALNSLLAVYGSDSDDEDSSTSD
ncbi:hypothetical protein GGI24_000301 [Coemansia furcata]|nr:hypothetical protein GGI24_000301 [Coemansia furcata]